MKKEHFDLPIGIVYDPNEPPVRNVELLPINGVAEKIILKRLATKPYTWTARVLTICIGKIGTKEIAGPAREKYLKTNQTEINNLITRMTLADVNTAILEIHRNLWNDKLDNQAYSCVHCGHKGSTTMDLDKIDYTPEQKEKMASGDLRDLLKFDVYLHNPIIFDSPKNAQGEASYPSYDGRHVVGFKFRAPMLIDGINNEKNISSDDSMVEFWRHIAKDCLVGAIIETESGNEDMEEGAYKLLTQRDLFSRTLRRQDLKKIRNAMYCESHPSLEFITEVECHNCGETTPVAISPASFFED